MDVWLGWLGFCKSIHPPSFFWRNRVQYPLASWHQHSLSAWKPPHVWTPTFASAAMKPFGIARPSSLAWAKGGTSGPFVRPSGFRGRDSLKGWYVKPYKNEGWPSPNMGFWTLFIYIYIHIYIVTPNYNNIYILNMTESQNVFFWFRCSIAIPCGLLLVWFSKLWLI